MPLTPDQRRDRHEQATRRQLRGKARPTVSKGTRRELVGPDGEQPIGVVKHMVRIKATRDLRDEFLRWIERHSMWAEPEDIDRPADEQATICDWWIVYGLPHQFDKLEIELIGDRRPVLYTQAVMNGHVGGTATGSGPMDTGSSVHRRVRSMLRGVDGNGKADRKRNREFREEAERLEALPYNHKDSPHRGELEARARGEATRLFPVVFDTSEETGPDGATLAKLFEQFYRFILTNLRLAPNKRAAFDRKGFDKWRQGN